MKLIIFGATGTLGRHLVEQALSEGHQVTAFARTPGTLSFEHPNLTRLAGDVFNQNAVGQAIDGHDAVLIALGSGRKGGVRAVGTQHVIDGMKRYGVRRLICLSTLGAGDSRALLNFFWKRIMFGLLLRKAYADHQAQEAAVRHSGLEWTIVRPGAFSDGSVTGNYRHGFPVTEKKLKLKISRADVADFMIGELTNRAYLRAAPGLSY